MRSDKMKKGIEKAPHRSLFNAVGMLAGGNGKADHRHRQFGV